MDILESYANRRVPFRFRGAAMELALSHALFSSAEVDEGTRLLLKSLASRSLLPETGALLDCGTGVGVIGIACALAAPALRVHCQDRDSLAVAFALWNARTNGIAAAPGGPGGRFTAEAGPMLGGLGGARFELLLSNVPAKAGTPVLRDFFARSILSLAPGGKAAVVVVEPLAEKALGWLREGGGTLLAEDRGKGHRVLIYGPAGEGGTSALSATEATALPPLDGLDIPDPYVRGRLRFSLAPRRGEDATGYSMATIYGCEEFDGHSHDTVLAAKLLLALEPAFPLLVHSPGQGHLAAALAKAWSARGSAAELYLSGRDSMALRASRANVLANLGVPVVGASSPAREASVAILPGYDIEVSTGALAEGTLGCLAIFPELCPERDWVPGAWRTAARLLRQGGELCVSASATEAQRFDKVRPKGFTRGPDIKRDGFRAMLFAKD